MKLYGNCIFEPVQVPIFKFKMFVRKEKESKKQKRRRNYICRRIVLEFHIHCALLPFDIHLVEIHWDPDY